MTISVDQLKDIIGSRLLDDTGNKIGTVQEIYLDRQTKQPEWIATHTGLFGKNVSFVPMTDATIEGDDVQVIFDEKMVKNAPNMDADGSLSEEQEDELYRYYGMSYEAMDTFNKLDDQPAPVQTASVGHDTSGPNTDDAMTRSEEELHVGTEQRTTGRARMHKFIVTEEQTITVPVSHEEVRMVTEPITDANVVAATSGPSISEEEHEVVLHEEVPVVTKQTVPKERVKLATETVSEEAAVTESVRKEQIRMENDDK